MTLPNSKPTSDLAQKTISGAFWSYLSFATGKGLSFLSTVILARLLLPAEFGLLGYCLIVIQYVDILNSAGIVAALVSRREKVEEAANAAFIANLIFGALCFSITWFIAEPVSVFFKAPEIVPLFRVLGLSLPFTALGMVPDAMLQREMRFRTLLISETSRNLVKGLVSIGLAFLGFGVWSLVLGQVFGVLTGAALSWMLAGWRPTWRFHPQATRAISFFGFHVILLETAGAFRNNVDYLLVGRILGAASLGLYTMAYRIPELLIRSLNYVLGNVSLAALSITQSDQPRMKKFYFGYLRYVSMFSFPVSVGLAFIAPVFIPLFLSEKWASAVVPTSLISMALCINGLGYVPGILYKAISRPDILNRLAFIKMPIAVAILWYATRWGIVGVAAAQIVIALISVSMDLLVANRVMHYSVVDLFGAISPSFTSTLSMAAVLFLIRQVVQEPGLLQMILMIVCGVLTYFAAFRVISPETLSQGIATVRSSLGRKKPAMGGVSND
jgi:O-antigen/teichoic acid export membrane protein